MIGPAFGAVEVYTDEQSFLRDSSNLIFEDFNQVSGNSNFDRAPYRVGSLTFEARGVEDIDVGNYFIQNDEWNSGINDIDGSNFVQLWMYTGHEFIISFDRPTNYFGGHFVSLNNIDIDAGETLQRTGLLVNGENVRIPPTTHFSGPRFVGFISDTSFTELVFFRDQASDNFGLDNIYFGSASEVPLPGAALLMGGALLGLGALRSSRA